MLEGRVGGDPGPVGGNRGWVRGGVGRGLFGSKVGGKG